MILTRVLVNEHFTERGGGRDIFNALLAQQAPVARCHL